MLLVNLVLFNTYILVWKPFICLRFCGWDLFEEQFGATARRDFIVVVCANYTCSWTKRLYSHRLMSWSPSEWILQCTFHGPALEAAAGVRCNGLGSYLFIFIYWLHLFVIHFFTRQVMWAHYVSFLIDAYFISTQCISYQCASEFNSGGCSYL